jgi:long-chain fatty acid transport protein
VSARRQPRAAAWAPAIAALASTPTIAAVASSAAVATVSSSVDAAGLWFSDRGVRPMGRAGAFVAGVDDLHGIWFNPAGLADAGDAALVDFAWLRARNTYVRNLRIVDADDTVRQVESPPVEGSSTFLPLPTMAASKTFGAEKRWTGAVGFIAPYVLLANYAERTADGQPSPARYTLAGFDGSALGIPGGWVAWKPHDSLRLGLGTFALIGYFQTRVTFSVSPQDRLLGAPEQPEWDAQSQMRVGPMLAPTVNGGGIWQPDPRVRIGVSGQAPMVISAPATLKVRLPTSVALDGASVRGENAHVRFVLPGILRVGVELRPLAGAKDVSAQSDLRIELTWVRELWSQHRSIEAQPEDIYLEGITGAPPSVAMPKITIPRNFVDSDSFRIGGEWSFVGGGYRMSLRTGLSYESSAVPKGYMSLSSLDFPKTTLSLGGGLFIGKKWRFDAVLAHMFVTDVNVPPGEARIPRITPLQGNAPLEAVNGGRYTATADLLGVGLNYSY